MVYGGMSMSRFRAWIEFKGLQVTVCDPLCIANPLVSFCFSIMSYVARTFPTCYLYHPTTLLFTQLNPSLSVSPRC